MNTKLVKLLVTICIGLSLVIAGEWLYARYSQQRLLTSIVSAKQQDYKTDELPGIELTKQPEDSYVDLVARPLFLKGRKPVDEPLPETEQAVATADSFDWQLNGIYSSQKLVSALFSRANTKTAGKDRSRKITVNDDLDGWKLTEIRKDRVILKQGGNQKELLLRKPKSKAVAAPAVASPFSMPPVQQGAVPSPFTAPPPPPAQPETIPSPFGQPAPAASPFSAPAPDTTVNTPQDEQ